MTEKEINKKLQFIEDYKNASNAATGSKFDANANVTNKNISTLQCELGKKDLLELNRALTEKYLLRDCGEELVEQFRQDLNNHIIYSHDETSLMSYCASISLYPYLLNGLKELGGSSGAPKHTNGFIGGLINLIFLVASQFAGAIAIPEFLTYMDHFLRLDFGDDYTEHLDEGKYTIRHQIEDWFQQLIYSINQPAGARNYQSPFTNIAYFDKYYFESIFRDFVFPDGDEPCYDTTKELQKIFMKWFNEERLKEVLTFPVETANILVEDGKYKDEEFADFLAYMHSQGHSFFIYQSDSVDALASCCFSGDEIIEIRDRKTLSIEKISIKEFCENHKDDYNNYEIISFNVDAETEEYTPITGTLIKYNEYHSLIEIESELGNIIRVTPEHILLVVDIDKGYIEIKAKDLVNNFNNYRLIVSNNFIDIKNIKIIESGKYVYDIELEKNHFFYANNILTHNCRLRNEIEENVFSYTLGAGGIETGSKKVITLNLNRIGQDWYKVKDTISLSDYIRNITKRVHKYLNAWDSKLRDDYANDMLPVYKAGFIELDKQFLTIGVNGFVELGEFLSQKDDTKYNGIKIDPFNEQYKELARDVLGTIKQVNKEDRTKEHRYNTECIPGENCSAKLYNWDKKDGYVVPSQRNLYNSYFFVVEDTTIDPVKKFYYQGNGFATECDGGVALHNNLDSHLSQTQYRKLMDVAVKAGCNYFTYNIPNTICNDCGHIDKRYLKECPVCQSTNVDAITRIIGYLRRISNFSEVRQVEASRRYYAHIEKE